MLVASSSDGPRKLYLEWSAVIYFELSNIHPFYRCYKSILFSKTKEFLSVRNGKHCSFPMSLHPLPCCVTLEAVCCDLDGFRQYTTWTAMYVHIVLC